MYVAITFDVHHMAVMRRNGHEIVHIHYTAVEEVPANYWEQDM